MCFSIVLYSIDVLICEFEDKDIIRYNKFFFLCILYYSKIYIYIKYIYRDFLDIMRFLFEFLVFIFKKNCYMYIMINGYNRVNLLFL